ncbi:MAG: alkaline phosphatase family protein [Planctomycetes bacterium]|nr:alkaline phosphatase family protein [Planctomycetota bacterium]
MLRTAVPIFVLMGVVGLVASTVINQRIQPVVAVLDQTEPPVDPIPSKPAGKLVVLVVFDQMRGDYMTKWSEYYGQGGFERLKKEGVWYSDVQIPYACTSTGPGHASLVTGAPPSVTGIIENEWWDRKEAKRVYCCQPLKRPFELVPPPPADAGKTGRGADTGFSPERLLAETVGDKLKASNGGKGRVVSLSIKDRTAVLMGGQKPDAAYCFDTRDGLFHTGTYYREQAHPWVSEFNGTKPADKWFEEKWDRFRPDLDYTKITGNPDDAPGEGFGFNGQGQVFPHVFKGKLQAPAKGYYDAVECSPGGNEMLLEFAKKAVVAEKLGQGETTDLLCVSFSSNDLIGHIYGPDSWEMLDVTLRADNVVADFLTFLDTTVGKDRYTLVMSADHGVCPIPEQRKFGNANRLPVTAIYNELSDLLNGAYEATPGGPTQWFETNDPKDLDRVWPWVYLNHTAIKSRGLTPEAVAETIRDSFVGRRYLETAFTRKQLETEMFAADSFGAKAKLAYHPNRCGDVIVIPKPGVLITGYANGTNHGSPQPYDSHVPVLAIGAGIPALGKQAEKKSSLIVAPILARGLGIPSPKDAVEKPPF